MKCYICKNTNFIEVQGKVRDIPQIPILKCTKCGLVFLSCFEHIDDKYYENSKMLKGMTIDKFSEETQRDDKRRHDYFLKRDDLKEMSFLDFGCGAGGFISQMTKSAKKCAGIEKDKLLRKFIKNKYNLKTYSNVSEIKEKFEIITLFHVLEHLENPKKVLLDLSKKLTSDGTIVIETPNINDALISMYDCKEFSEFTYWGCHLYYFSIKTLTRLLNDAGFIILHMNQIQRYPLANHLYWLSKGKPDGHNIWKNFKNKDLDIEYQKSLIKRNACDTLLATVIRK